MVARAIRAEDGAGLALALALHAGIFVLLVRQPAPPRLMPEPDRIAVTLTSEVGPVSTSPRPTAEPAAAAAPEASLAPPNPPAPPPAQPVAARPRPPQAEARPVPRPVPAPPPRSASAPAPPATARTVAVARPSPPRQAASASRISNDFLNGMTDRSTRSESPGQPAATVGPAVRAAIGQAIARELKPHWIAPQGAEAELLVTVVRFRLARDGSLAGEPEVVRQTGVTDANRAQLQRHREQAVRAVRLAAPFDLPEEYYAGWQVVTSTFDKRLSQ